MSRFIQLELDTGAAKTWILLEKTSKLADIFSTIAKKYDIDRHLSNIMLYNQGRYLPFSQGESLSDYGLTHLSKLDLQVTLPGGIWPLTAIKVRKTELRPLPGFITVTTSPTEPDMISLEADPKEKRARMPCGHVIGPSSMTSYCQSLLSEGRVKFFCPSVDSKTGKSNCGKEWEYFLVRHVACLSDDENQAFEKKISDNYLQKADGLQQCPSCTVWCFKDSKMGNFVRCPMCKTDFCWACLRDWIASNNSRICGNPDCDGRDNREKILAECPLKKINECAECPSIRACPRCLLLVEHKDMCGHMSCPDCQYGFCFICLRGKTSSGDWPCPPVGNCPLAPRQAADRLSGLTTTMRLLEL